MIENAVDFAQSRVEVIAKWTDNGVSLRICDDGPGGFAETVMHRLGDPYVTTRASRNTEETDNSSDRTSGHLAQSIALNGGGLGLGGFFIAKTLLERSGARVRISNKGRVQDGKTAKKANEVSGAVIDIFWPRAILETDQEKK